MTTKYIGMIFWIVSSMTFGQWVHQQDNVNLYRALMLVLSAIFCELAYISKLLEKKNEHIN